MNKYFDEDDMRFFRILGFLTTLVIIASIV